MADEMVTKTESAHGEIFYEIDFGWIIYILAAIAVAIIAYALYTRIRLWRVGKPDNRFETKRGVIKQFIKTVIVDGVFHRRFFQTRNPATPTEIGIRIIDKVGHSRFLLDSWGGINHLLMFAGTGFLLVAASASAISHYIYEFLEGNNYLAVSCIGDAGGMLVLLGVLGATLRRYVKKAKHLDTVMDDGITLLLVFVVVITGFIVAGMRQVIADTPSDWAQWSFLSYGFSKGFEDVTLLQYQIFWWAHSIVVIGAVIYISFAFTKLSHILISPINVFFRSGRPKGALAPIPDIENMESFGASKIEDFTWKQLMDLDACTRCGRCQANCPTSLTRSALSPKKLVQDLKTHLYEVYPIPKITRCRREHVAPEARRDMTKEVITEKVIWECTTCRACEEVCPVFIEHTDKIIDMRRHLVLDEGSLPETVMGALKSIEQRGHPWRGTMATRTGWTHGLNVKVIDTDAKVDILYWVGCTAALEDRNIEVAKAMGKVFNAAGVSFGILGEEEVCCGEPARRIGNEYLFQLLAQQNVEKFKRYGIKKIITACPHCYNTLKNEYPQFGGDFFEVIHHAEFIYAMVSSGKLKPTKDISRKITFHDPCYLGRYNDIYDVSRKIITQLPKAQLVEMGHHRNKAFCCGGGGGHIWMKENGIQINKVRIEEAIETGANMIATACPFCIQMLDDGLKAKCLEKHMKLKDVAEIIAEAI